VKNYYLLFDNSKSAIAFYAELKKAGIRCTMAPTPRNADTCCGVSILYYNEKDKKQIEETREKVGASITRFWECDNEDDPERYRFC